MASIFFVTERARPGRSKIELAVGLGYQDAPSIPAPSTRALALAELLKEAEPLRLNLSN